MATAIKANANAHIGASEKRMWCPISSSASPSASHKAGENGERKVPTMLPISKA